MITYKNITDVEVLEQASENTKVLVNEGGELMQAPYSNFEDKMNNAEVLEEIPENAKVLVNDNGKLKQAACGAFGGSVATAIIKQDGYDNALVGIATANAAPTFTFTCTNMTFDEAVQIIMSGEPLAVIGMSYYEGWGSLFFINFNHVEYIAFYYTIPTIMCEVVGDDSYTMYWTPNGISNREPPVPTES